MTYGLNDVREWQIAEYIGSVIVFHWTTQDKVIDYNNSARRCMHLHQGSMMKLITGQL